MLCCTIQGSKIPYLLFLSIFLAFPSCKSDIHDINWKIEFEDEKLQEQAHTVEAALLRGGCSGTELRSWECENRKSCAPTDPQEQAFQMLSQGSFGFYARARNKNCQWYAAGCQPAALSDSVSTVTTRLRASALRSICLGHQECIDGECLDILPDADIEDSDVHDADEDEEIADADFDADIESEPDAEPDEEIIVDPCEGTCAPCEECIDGTCETMEEMSACNGEVGFCVLQDYSVDEEAILGCCSIVLDDSPEGFIIDDRDPCGTHTGIYDEHPDVREGYWREAPGNGYLDSSWWTLAVNRPEGHWSSAKWNFSVRTPGNYKLEAYIPSHIIYSEKVIYEIDAGDAHYHSSPVSHGAKNTWVNVGTFSFFSGERFSVKIGDATGEDLLEYRQISFDAIKFTFQAPTR